MIDVLKPQASESNNRFGLLLPELCLSLSPPPESEAEPRDFTQGQSLATQAHGHSLADTTAPKLSEQLRNFTLEQMPGNPDCSPNRAKNLGKSKIGSAHVGSRRRTCCCRCSPPVEHLSRR